MKSSFFRQGIIVGIVAAAACLGRAAEEQTFIAVLQSNADAVAKCAACVQLRIYGTAESVSALASVLNDERVGHAARYALEGMPCPEADAALREAITATSGHLRIGLVNSVGWRRDKKAVPLLIPFLSDTDSTLATAAAGALARIGGPEAVAALIAAGKNSSSAIKTGVSQALLQCAEDQLNTEKTADAMAIYKELFKNAQDSAIRAASLKGICACLSGQEQMAWIKTGLTSDDPVIENVAIQMASEIEDDKSVQMIIAALPTLKPHPQAAIIRMLGERGEKAALKVVTSACDSGYPQVRAAALTALGNLGDVSCAELLLARAANDGDEAQAAQDSLSNMKDPELNSHLIQTLDKQSEAIQVQIIDALTRREVKDAVKPLIDFTLKAEPSSKSAAAATKAIGKLADGSDFDLLINLLGNVPTSQKQLLEPTISRLVRDLKTNEGSDAISTLIEKAKASTDSATKESLIRILGMTGTPKALEYITEQMNSNDKAVASTSLRAVGNWPGSEAMETLRETARKSSGVDRAIALQGFIRMIGLSDAGPDKKMKLYKEAFEIADRVQEKRSIIGGLGSVYLKDSLQMLAQLMNQSELKAEAEVSLVKISEKLYGTYPQLIGPLMEKIQADHGDDYSGKNAAAVLQLIRKSEGYITAWQQSRPYGLKGLNLNGLFEHPFEPELNPATDGDWEIAMLSGDSNMPYLLDFKTMYPSLENSVIYARTVLTAEQAQTVSAELGSDDGAKVWLNGSLVFAKNAPRAFKPGQDKFKFDLKQGRNLLMVKVTQQNQGWSVAIRLLGSDGQIAKGVICDPQVTAADLPVQFEKKPGQQGSLKDIEGSLVFEKTLISKTTYEAASVFDVNKDGVKDIVSGEYWFAGPDFKTKYKICSVKPQNDYFDDFSDFPMDVNGDGYLDIVTGAWFTGTLRWCENPKGGTGEWTVHTVEKCGSIETIRYWDVDGDGHLEVVPNLPGKPLSVYRLLRDTNGNGIGQFEKITLYQNKQGHGLGFGDINGDGRNDFVLASGWLEAPEKPYQGDWIFHAELNLGTTSVPILVYDVNQDGKADLIEGQGHNYGLNWWEQKVNATGQRTWIKHPIDTLASQYHDLALVDLDNDGSLELVTGKRYKAHSGHDPGTSDPIGLYYFKINKGQFQRVTLDYGQPGTASGAGIYFWVDDIDNNGFKDIVAPGKEGLYLFKNMGNRK